MNSACLRMLRLGMFGLLVTTTSIPAAHAGILVDQPLDIATPFWGWSSNSGDQQIAENFVLSGAAQANLVAFSGYISGGPASASFDILFFNNDPSPNNVGGVPDVSAFYSYNTGVISGVFQANDDGVDIYQWTTLIPTADFLNGGTYWISIRSTDSNSFFIWEHSTTNGDNTLIYRPSDTDPWIVTGTGTSRDAQAVRIDGDYLASVAVPETTSLITFAGLGICMVAGGWLRQRQQPKKQ